MKRDELLRRIATRAREQGVGWKLDRQGANHEIWRCGAVRVPIPRHVEIGNGVAQMVFEELETELGKDWWRR
jgi:hypothetical protein